MKTPPEDLHKNPLGPSTKIHGFLEKDLEVFLQNLLSTDLEAFQKNPSDGILQKFLTGSIHENSCKKIYKISAKACREIFTKSLRDLHKISYENSVDRFLQKLTVTRPRGICKTHLQGNSGKSLLKDLEDFFLKNLIAVFHKSLTDTYRDLHNKDCEKT